MTETALGEVVIGSRVRIRDDDGEEEFVIVTPDEARAGERRISVRSAMGGALLGRLAGATVHVRAPGGVRVVQVVDVR